MACITHDCLQCGYIWHDNGEQKICPACKKDKVHESFDEAGDFLPNGEPKEREEEDEISDPDDGAEP